MVSSRWLAVAAVLSFGCSHGASAATYEAIYKGTETFGTVTANVEADFYYDLSFGKITDATTYFPLSQGGIEVTSIFAGQPLEESARLYISTLGTYYFGSETSFTAEYIQYSQIGQSAVLHEISGLDGALSGSFLASGGTTIPADVKSAIPLMTASDSTGDYAITNGPSGTFLVQSVEVIAPSAVPLPASAPEFAMALLALGTAGFGMKRKRTIAAI